MHRNGSAHAVSVLGCLLPCKPARRGSLSPRCDLAHRIEAGGGAKSRQARPEIILSYFLMIITNFLQSTIAEQIVIKPFVAIDLENNHIKMSASSL